MGILDKLEERKVSRKVTTSVTFHVLAEFLNEFDEKLPNGVSRAEALRALMEYYIEQYDEDKKSVLKKI